jgi:hypothetical protein
MTDERPALHRDRGHRTNGHRHLHRDHVDWNQDDPFDGIQITRVVAEAHEKASGGQEDRTEAMISYGEVIDHRRCTILLPDDRKELASATAWLRKNIGKSHGPWQGAWWVRPRTPANPREVMRREIVIIPGPHMVLVNLTWM